MTLATRILEALPLSENLSRTLGYISVRAALALFMAFLIGVAAGKPLIQFLTNLKARQYIRKMESAGAVNLFEMHGSKQGTPTMGGLLILLSTFAPVALFCDWSRPEIPLIVALGAGFAALGFLDDYRKIAKRDGEGISAKTKLALQIALGLAFGAAFYYGEFGVRYSVKPGWGEDGIALPFLKNAAYSLGPLFILYAAFVLSASANGSNITDGLDGLAVGVMLPVAGCLGLAAYLAGRVDTSAYLLIPYAPGGGEVAVLLAALLGAGLGFLWWNSYPAHVFAGDTGSMFIGGVLGASALLVKQEFLLAIVGGIFVAESLSVILQVASYRLFRKRIFLMAPFHHHLEKLKWPESKITIRLWIVSLLLAMVGVSTLKIR